MRGMGLGHADAVVTAEYVRRGGRGLEEVDVKDNQLDMSSMQLLFSALSGCPRLKGLAVGHNPVFDVRSLRGRGGEGDGGVQGAGEKGAGAAAKLFAQLKVMKLEKLGMGSTGMDDESLRCLSDALPSMKQLKVPYVSSCQIS
eukprot:749701-Hanusia_phi.AAC.1